MTTTHDKKAHFLLIAPILFAAQLLLSALVWSQSSSLGAHVHGEAELMIAIESGRVEIQLVSPAANILGFEHAPSTTEQHEQIHRAENILSEARALFEFDGASCQPISQTVDTPFSDELSETNHPQHDHAQKETDQHNEHAEVVARYLFECDGRAPTSLQTLILDQFPAIESLDVQWITETKQGAQELKLKQPRVDLR